MNKLMFLAFDCVSDCGGADILRILKFVFKLLDLVLFIVPIGLIIMIMIDFSKNVIAGKEDEMKKNAGIVVKRLIYCMVIFLVPTIVNFAIGLVSNTGDNIIAKASYCIDYAKKGNLSVCEVNYETLEKEINRCYVCEFNDGRDSIYVWDSEKPANDHNGCASDFYTDMTKTKDTCKVMSQCYKCSDNDDIFVWGTVRPNKGTNGCNSDFSVIYGLDSQEKCNNTNSKQCYQCMNGTGYVLSIVQPSRGFKYDSSNSFNITPGVDTCVPGFNNNPVERCNCTTTGCSSE